ncbi:MAG: hypothetical protein GXO21_04315 [Aquificae bacterium]|nr:hypothetical protein [Aquificota bacterium]
MRYFEEMYQIYKESLKTDRETAREFEGAKTLHNRKNHSSATCFCFTLTTIPYTTCLFQRKGTTKKS